MNCPKCNHHKSRSLKKVAHNGGFARVRICEKCHTVWTTVEKVDQRCPQCGGGRWTVIRLYRHGAEMIIRERRCRGCGYVLKSVEKKAEGHLCL